jgi:hypothetical protein
MRRFAEQDQERFARLSGDWNPMHMDPVAARRTQAGAPVVHGVHLTLWTLDTLLRDGVVKGPVASVQAVFNKFVYLDTPTDIRVVRVSDDAVEAIVSSAGVDTTTVTIGLGSADPVEAAAMDQPPVVTQGRLANVPELSAMAKQSGWMDPVGSEDMFTHAARLLGARRVGAIALTSRLVGMLYPGLHSVFGSLDVAIVPEHPRPGLGFYVATANIRTRLLRMPVAGSGIAGTVIAFARREAVAQPAMAEIAPLVAAGSFAGAVALVTGGSRGLGALTARILAAGDARVFVTYALGQDDADALVAEINGFMGSPVCSAVRYDMMTGDCVAADGVTHLYHFASPRIYRQKSALFDAGVFAEFTRAYLGSFHDLCRSLPGLRVAFYPSSVFVEPGRPRDMTEYAMIKAAGEILCEEMSATEGFPTVVWHRLPRMLTDQTATLARVSTDDALTTMLPVVRDVQATGVPA